jgi:hypothetical protein
LISHFGPLASGDFTHFVAVEDPDLLTTQIVLARDEWMFAITAVNSDGLESEVSNVVHVYPGPPGGAM